MHSSNIFEFQQAFTIFSLDTDTSGNPLSTPPDVYDKNRLNIVLDGVTLVEGTDYTVLFMNGGAAVIRGFNRPLTTASVLQFFLYSNASKTTVVNSFSTSIKELGGTLTLSKSTVTSCDSSNVNSYLNSRATIGFSKEGASAPVRIKSGSGSLNLALTSDFQYQSIPQIGSASNLTFSSGVLTNSISGDDIIEAVTTERAISLGQSFIIETTYEKLYSGGEYGIDAFLIDGVGFARIEHPSESYEVLSPQGVGTDHSKVGLAQGTVFRIEATTTEYILTVGGTEIARYNRNSTYSSDKGSFTSASVTTPTNPLVVPYNTPVVFHPTSPGTGYIDVRFNVGIGKRVAVTTIFPSVPSFAGGNSYSNTCPSSTFNLGSLVDSNSNAGYSLEFHSVSAPTSDATKLTNLNVGAGTYYAVQKQNLVSCYSASRSITVSINSCCVEVTSGSIQGTSSTTIDDNELFSVTGLNGTGPYTYLWSVVRGTIIGSNTGSEVVIRPTGHPMLVTLIVNNCSGVGNATFNRTVNVTTECVKTVNIDLSCKLNQITAISGTIQGVTEPNRVTEWSDSYIKFRTSPGLHNYYFVLTGGPDEQPVTVTLKNIVCS